MPRQRWTVFISGAAIAIAGLVAYHNSFSGPFILDDTWNIVANPSIRHLWRLGRVLSPQPIPALGGRPLYNLSFAVNYAWGGTSVRGYHVLNLAIHLLAGLTLFGIVRRTLRNSNLALAIAILWTVHPLLTESVTYISERSELLMGLFYLLTLYCFIRANLEIRTERSDRYFNSKFEIFSIAACLLGMASKQSMVTAPVVVFLYDRTFVAGSFREAWRRRRGYYLGLAGTWVLLAILMAGPGDPQIGSGHGVTAWAYAATECQVVLKYIRLALWPHPLVLDYGSGVVRPGWAVLPYGAVVVAVLAGTAWLLVGQFRDSKFEVRNFRALGFTAAFFFLVLAPTSSFVPVGPQPMAENRMYLPLAAIVVLVAAGIHAVAGRMRGLVFAALAVVLAVLTIQRNAVYASGLSIWTDTVVKCPQSARAHSNLGAALYRAGRKPEATGQLEEAVRINPGDALTHLMLGNLLAEGGRSAEAIIQYQEALQIDPALAQARARLSSLTTRGGQGN